VQQPRAPVFTGRLWILIDGGTFSTAAEFCSVARSLKRGTFIGEETGGTYEGNTSGTFAILTLPHTGIRAIVPLVRYRLAVTPPAHPGRGIIPDYAVNVHAPGRESAPLDRALELIRAARIRSKE
jgi:C-terminal processing protease CtpA/Prc